ncbi:MAG: hypothetical protein HYV96_01435 [Opitutae bacterium]|nr:hypothetical protein [Opitutae bacterium]
MNTDEKLTANACHPGRSEEFMGAYASGHDGMAGWPAAAFPSAQNDKSPGNLSVASVKSVVNENLALAARLSVVYLA